MTQDPEDIERAELERRVDRAVKRLPAPPAPAHFSARVMQRIQAGPLPDAVPASFEWPVALKIAVMAVSAALIVSALVFWPLALEFARTSWQSPAALLLRDAAAAVRPMVPAALIYLTAMCVACAAAASMLKHVALGGATHS
jgi:hypothetical protein